MALLKSFRLSWLVWHRRLGLVTCFGVLLWGLSGMTHPIMTHLQPAPAAFTAPSTPLQIEQSMAPGEVLARNNIAEFRRLAAVNLDNVAYYRVVEHAKGAARYFSSVSSAELESGDEYYARQLASHYTGRPIGEIASARYVTQFDDEYPAISQLLPVWRVEFSGKDHLRAYIDTDQARLSTLVDDTRYTLTKVFRFGHNWAFLDGVPRLQLSVMALVLAIALFSAVSGLTLYFRRRRHSQERLAKQPLRRWHRRIGLLVALSTLLFVSSGIFHLVMSYRQQHAPAIIGRDSAIPTSMLSTTAWQSVNMGMASRIDLVGQHWLLRNETPASQVAVMSHEHHHDMHSSGANILLPATENAAAGLDMLTLARSQAADYARMPIQAIVQTELVSQFGAEYGFVFKRLPVVKVQFHAPGNPRYYIEPATGALAVVVRDIDATEGWTFAYLHKWVWLDAHKDLRDVLVMLFALGNVIVALLGLWLFSRQSRP